MYVVITCRDFIEDVECFAEQTVAQERMIRIALEEANCFPEELKEANLAPHIVNVEQLWQFLDYVGGDIDAMFCDFGQRVSDLVITIRECDVQYSLPPRPGL